MALKLTLKPGEKFVINGAVVVNGGRRSHLLIQNNVSILRERDVMLPEDANTPVRRIYFAIMMLYLDDSGGDAYSIEFERRMAEFSGAIADTGALGKCAPDSPARSRPRAIIQLFSPARNFSRLRRSG